MASADGMPAAVNDATPEMVRAGDEAAFGRLVERHRRELQVHCYRMLGSFEDSEDLVQETFLRAWRKRDTFEGRATFRAWLYRIATNACLDVLASKPRRVLPHQVTPAADPRATPLPPADLPWLQPYPDRLLEPVASRDDEPETAVVARETIELAFLAAIQYLPARQRATLVLRDVLGWSAKDTATLLDASVPSVNSALQRARATIKEHLPPRRMEWSPPPARPNEQERVLLRRFMDAHEQADVGAVAVLLREDARASMPPHPMWFQGRDTIVTGLARGFDPSSPHYMGSIRMVATEANRQPAAAGYLRRPGDTRYRAFGLDVLRVEDGLIAEIIAFSADLFPAFDLPMYL